MFRVFLLWQPPAQSAARGNWPSRPENKNIYEMLTLRITSLDSVAEFNRFRIEIYRNSFSSHRGMIYDMAECCHITYITTCVSVCSCVCVCACNPTYLYFCCPILFAAVHRIAENTWPWHRHKYRKIPIYFEDFRSFWCNSSFLAILG